MLTYAMDERGDECLYGYLYHCIRRDIESGTIAAGQRLPSKRALAKNLGVSLITVEGAYQQLVAEGYVQTYPRKGYYACTLGAASPARQAVREVPATASTLESSPNRPPLVADLTGRTAPRGLFPYATWAKTIREVLTCESEDALMAQTEPAGSMRLREELARHLRSFRGMDVDPARIVVGAGAQTLYGFIVQLLGRELGYAVEDPGYPRLTKIYRANDVRLSHIPLDEGGVRMDMLRASGADIAHIMPSHQFPTGRVMPVSRRYELLGWASELPGRVVVEDDYDCEFRLAGRPIPTLASIDATGCVIYTNTFAKSLGPAFRIGYMVLPEAIAANFDKRIGFYANTVSIVEQLALARFMANGDYERHVNRARAHFRAVRNELVEALRACPIADRLDIEATDAGLHFLMDIRTGVPDTELVAAARKQGLALAPLSDYCQKESCEQAGRFVINFSSLAHEDVAPSVDALTAAVHKMVF